MYHSPLRDRWVALLPVGGVDGSLAARFGGDPRGASVHAKTGTVSHVSALSGYLLPAEGGKYAFSILVNGYTCPAAEIRNVVDKILLTLLERKH
jgi:D-alanyl-D-alanine carboxypeptidase/D-alanyl-D-alanine-endopeptidase (penicillin-binding protein 4)